MMEMEINYPRKDRNRVYQNLAIRILILLILLNFISCGVKIQNDVDSYIIINNEIRDLVSNVKKGNTFLEKKLNNNRLKQSLKEDLKYNESSFEFHFLTYYYSLAEEDFKYLFNEKQIQHYREQLIDEDFIIPSKIKNKNLGVVDFNKESSSSRNGIDDIDKVLIVLSRPVFTKDNKYALIGYYFGGYLRNGGSEGITIYKKENGNWVVYKRILLGIG